jgi:hypothetical protein
MGPSPRGGAYTYDWIENLLGLNMHSADHVLPEFQHPQVGESVGFGTKKMTFAVVEAERGLASQSADGKGNQAASRAARSVARLTPAGRPQAPAPSWLARRDHVSS